MATKNVNITLIDILDTIRCHRAGAFIFNRQPVAVMPALIEGNRRTVVYTGTCKIIEIDLDNGNTWVFLDQIEGADEAVLKTAERLLNFIYNDIVDPKNTTAVFIRSEGSAAAAIYPVSPFVYVAASGAEPPCLAVVRADGARTDPRSKVRRPYRVLQFRSRFSAE